MTRPTIILDRFITRASDQRRPPQHNFSVDPRELPAWLVDFIARIEIERPAPKPLSSPYERPY